MYKIFFKENEIILSNKLVKKSNIIKSHIIVYNIDLLFNIKKFLIKFENKSYKIIIYCLNIDFLFKEFCKYFCVIHAAGGIVTDLKNNLILIHRFGKWDLPKGKVEICEKFKETALREVKEECGINELQIQRFFKTTYHIFYLNNIFYLKCSHWYLMKTNSNVNLTPQINEGISEVVWKSKKEIYKLLDNSYKSIKYLIYDYYSNKS